ncbi:MULTISPECIES: phosphatase PAP2 family protein [unclassified Streptomyces]|uniref:phosphatase PAP2 family protein n=1 Tax=unclassified Streptomyces TaxID=2593676 RepID=UPI001F04FCA8|nr:MULTISPECIES: phosphatase PAP2 family protein [unclassified Streptomyces]MCH0565374.1 phosphatase PAP2 family protein [Streptomyces sp. MUM 2J]MCH0573281.1 phosphatase PAP2 family protein [Streptomyces sp. MUM 136J]
MRETPRPRGTVGDPGPGLDELRPGRALAHTAGASGSGSPHRSDGRPPHTPRGARRSDPDGHPGTSPPVPGRPASFPPRSRLPPLLVLPAVVFALITWQVLADGPLLRLDARLSRLLVAPDRFSELLADLGNVQVAVPVLAVAAVRVTVRGRAAGADRWWLPPAAAAVVMALVPALVVPLKEWTDRPGTPVVPPASGYYPSGHTTTAAVAYGGAVLLLLPWLRSAAARRVLVLAGAALVLGVSYGLVRRGYHWPLDVVAGWCLGTVLLVLLGSPLSRSSRRRPAGTPGSRTGPS